MIKDFLKSLNAIHKDTVLTLEEKHLLTILIKYYNVDKGYSYPTYEILLKECSTKRRSKISKIIKGLKEKNYIEVIKVKGNKSHYYVKKYLYLVKNSKIEEKEVEDEVVKKVIENKEATIEDIKITKSAEHKNNSKVAKLYSKSKTFKLTNWFMDRLAKVDETILDMVVNKDKAKTAKMFLIKCIERSLMAGLELAPILKNTLEYYSKIDLDYAFVKKTKLDTRFYVEYTDKKYG